MTSDPSKNRTCDLLFRNKFSTEEAGHPPCQNASERVAINQTGPRPTHNEGVAKLNGRHPSLPRTGLDLGAMRVAFEQRAAWAQLGAPCVYFVRAGDFLKIGKCSGAPETRMAQLQTGCPYAMRLEVFFRGDVDLERQFHAEFARYRVSGGNEWFHFEGALRIFVEEMSAYFGIGEALQ